MNNDKKIRSKLYLIPVEIAADSHHKVIPAYVKEIIHQLDFFVTENARSTRRFISRLRLGRPIEELDVSEFEKGSDQKGLDTLMRPLLDGHSMGLLSEAGCPGIADPGAGAVAWAHRHGIEVVPLTGPSSILLALMGSGLNGQMFSFRGYLPIDEKELTTSIRKLEETSTREGSTQIFIETPYRNDRLMKALLRTLRDDTLLCIARDLTGTEESILTKPVREWRKSPPSNHKVPVVYLFNAG